MKNTTILPAKQYGPGLRASSRWDQFTARVVTLTQTDPPVEAAHSTSAMMAKVVDISATLSNGSGVRTASTRTG